MCILLKNNYRSVINPKRTARAPAQAPARLNAWVRKNLYAPLLPLFLLMPVVVPVANASLMDDSTRQYTIIEEGYVNRVQDIEAGVQSLLDDPELAGVIDLPAGKSLSEDSLESRSRFIRSPAIFVDVGTLLFSDGDRDGFFSGFSVSVDIDIIHSSYREIPVFVRVFLRPPEEPFQLFHVSDRFSVFRSLVSDTYRIESELVSNFPAGYYDMQLELVDAITGETLDVIDALSHRALVALPLESIDQSGVLTQLNPIGVSGGANTPESLNDATSSNGPVREAIVREHVGSMWLLLPILLLNIGRRRFKSRLTA